ncbi:MAG: CgeB family protein [Anaerolineae bacterium]
MPEPPWGRTELYASLSDLQEHFLGPVREADLVVVGSFVPEGVAVGKWVTDAARGVTAFYDIDTPVTLAKLDRGDEEYLAPWLIPRYGLYLSFTGGPTLNRLAHSYGARNPRALYCAVDPTLYYPEQRAARWDLSYMGTFSPDRQPALEELMLRAAVEWPSGRFVVAGPQYPESMRWPANVERIYHLAPAHHRDFYTASRFTLNITRSDMVAAGYSPSVRLFEAGACATPVISDYWHGLESFFHVGDEIMVSRSAEDTLRILRTMPEDERVALGSRARQRVLAEHTAAHRAAQLESHALALLQARAVPA